MEKFFGVLSTQNPMETSLKSLITLSAAFAFFVMCPRMAGMCAVISKIKDTNPYAIAFFGSLIAVPLIAFMVYLTIRFGIHAAIIAAVLTDLIAAVFTGTFKIKYGIEIAVIALFIWAGVFVAGKVSTIFESILNQI